MKKPHYGLRTTVLLFDTVVEQDVCWSNRADWSEVSADVPVDQSTALGWFRWCGDTIELRTPDNKTTTLSQSDQVWSWTNMRGVEVRLDRIQMERARRGTGEAWGDVALLVLMLTLTVGVAQLNAVLRMVVGDRVESTSALEPSPELIARYLKQEFGGSKSGQVARVDRNEQFRKQPLVYLPAGSQGPLTRAGGGAVANAEPARRAPSPDTSDSVERSPQPDPEPHLQSDKKSIVATVPPEPASKDNAPKPRPSIERFVGWGFHDWLDVAESNPQADKEMEERLRLAQEIMRIDPDDPFALLTVSYYAYLSENHQLCRDLYQRYIELYPEDAAGWNNLALSYKRTGEYGEEEKLYRIALAIEPSNSNTKNNLAVNLAHQGRYGEARQMMEQLQSAPEEIPYAELHRAKIAAAEGKQTRAYRHLKKALSLVERLDTFHHIEFRQDIRLDPSFDALRDQNKFRDILRDTYGEQTPLAIGQTKVSLRGVSDG